MCFDWASCITLYCPSHRNMKWEIQCPYGNEYGRPGRACSVYRECDCRLSDDERDKLYDEEAMPCPQSVTGLHYDISNSDIFPGIPLTGCWAIRADCADEHVEEFQLKHGDGVWFVLARYGDDCDEGMSFVPLARLES